ncbi:MAG: YdiU family protein [Thiohalocapsa sp. PB-PSB1]|jgi:uncharacterized protein YdiU (UPF0061 family)|nr:MAG: hypothetical protein N838_16315 [Thiohalocapsa sp. PB-PSB1]QQO53059.1 MAG: YdiU family protein [Thiohalocapsa sp. PB-PSB1]HCS91791.1 YdiU family protein [Chromatiaceae bacterium]
MSATQTAHNAPLRALENSYLELPPGFYARVAPTPVARPRLLRVNRDLAEQLGLDPNELASEAGTALLAGNQVPAGAEPLAMAYAGHQYGQFVPSLGDGRAILLGERIDRDGQRFDIQLKGAGRTPFSRMGDGRAVLGPVLREYVLGEAMVGLGIPTTRALAMVASGEEVYRERIEQGAVLTRVAASHVRVGTFEYFARRGDVDSVRQLADYVIQRHYPDCRQADNPYQALLAASAARQGELIARWLLVGFIHGVMNTDNMTISGETIDYGPCAFMDTYQPDAVYSSIDRFGRYAYQQQPSIGMWNLTQLAQCLLPLLDTDDDVAQQQARAALSAYVERFEETYASGLRAKIGLADGQAGDQREDDALVQDLLARMAENNVDFTNCFRLLCELKRDDPVADPPLRALFAEPDAFDSWAEKWRARLARQSGNDAERSAAMRAVNPAYIPRNHRVQQVIDAAEENDFKPLENLLQVVSHPFEEHAALAEYRLPPRPEEVVRQTFCGT